MKKFMALALVSSFLCISHVSAYSVPERNYGAFDELIRALTFWKPKTKSLPTPKRSLVELPPEKKKIVQPKKVKKLSVKPSVKKVVKKTPKVEAKVVATVEKVSEIQEKEVPAVEPLAQEKVEAKPVVKKQVQKKSEAETIKAIVQKKNTTQKVNFANKKRVLRPKKREYVRHDRFMDFHIPERLMTQIFDPKHSETSGTVTGEIIQSVNHQVPNPDLRAQGIQELVGVGISNFTGSDKARLHNIHNSVSKFDGRIIKRGEEFSFNEILSNAGPSNGFVLSKVIINGMTKYGWGGGVCQLSTTVFRSVFNAGLPITARRNHTFKVPYYQPQGFDATIYLGGQDFKFINTTPGDLMIQIAVQGDNMAVLLYGTRDRKTEVVGPVRNGMKYTWNRTITKDGESEEETLVSYYQREIKPVASAE